MNRRSTKRLTSAAVAAVLAAAVAVPALASTCSPRAASSKCCCCHHSSPTDGDSSNCHPSPTAKACAAQACGCSRPADPQTAPPERTTLPGPAESIGFLPTGAVGLHGGVEFAALSPANRSGPLAAIPHRILHCSWLI